MAISVSVSSQNTSHKKTMWAWVVSEKTNKFGSAPTESKIVGELLAVHSVLKTIPGSYDIIIRTQHKNVAAIINRESTSEVKNPVVLKIYEFMQAREGKVTAVRVTNSTISDEDRRCYKMTLVLTKKYNPPVQSITPPKREPIASPIAIVSPGRSLLNPKRNDKVKVSVNRKPANPRPKKRPERLTTGLEDWDDVSVNAATLNWEKGKGKPVMCESCNAPISPLTNECLCSD